jgi:hypothetical protein
MVSCEIISADDQIGGRIEELGRAIRSWLASASHVGRLASSAARADEGANALASRAFHVLPAPADDGSLADARDAEHGREVAAVDILVAAALEEIAPIFIGRRVAGADAAVDEGGVGRGADAGGADYAPAVARAGIVGTAGIAAALAFFAGQRRQRTDVAGAAGASRAVGAARAGGGIRGDLDLATAGSEGDE